MINVDELVRDEIIIIIAENRKENIDMALSFVAIIPGAASCTFWIASAANMVV